MALNIRLYFRSGNTQLLERVNYTEKLRRQLNNRVKSGIIIDFEVFLKKTIKYIGKLSHFLSGKIR